MGIEVSLERHSAGLQLLEYVESVLEDRNFMPFAPPQPEACNEGDDLANSSSSSNSVPPLQPPSEESRCRLVAGSLEDASLQARFMLGASVLFVNNAEGIFAPAIAGRDLNDAVSRVARRLAVGSRVVSLDSLPGLDVLVSAGAFTLARCESSPGEVSWREQSMKAQPLYHYTKAADHWTCDRCGWASNRVDVSRDVCARSRPDGDGTGAPVPGQGAGRRSGAGRLAPACRRDDDGDGVEEGEGGDSGPESGGDCHDSDDDGPRYCTRKLMAKRRPASADAFVAEPALSTSAAPLAALLAAPAAPAPLAGAPSSVATDTRKRGSSRADSQPAKPVAEPASKVPGKVVKAKSAAAFPSAADRQANKKAAAAKARAGQRRRKQRRQ